MLVFGDILCYLKLKQVRKDTRRVISKPRATQAQWAILGGQAGLKSKHTKSLCGS
jgi:hypothetical protein